MLQGNDINGLLSDFYGLLSAIKERMNDYTVNHFDSLYDERKRLSALLSQLRNSGVDTSIYNACVKEYNNINQEVNSYNRKYNEFQTTHVVPEQKTLSLSQINSELQSIIPELSSLVVDYSKDNSSTISAGMSEFAELLNMLQNAGVNSADYNNYVNTYNELMSSLNNYRNNYNAYKMTGVTPVTQKTETIPDISELDSKFEKLASEIRQLSSDYSVDNTDVIYSKRNTLSDYLKQLKSFNLDNKSLNYYTEEFNSINQIVNDYQDIYNARQRNEIAIQETVTQYIDEPIINEKPNITLDYEFQDTNTSQKKSDDDNTQKYIGIAAAVIGAAVVIKILF